MPSSMTYNSLIADIQSYIERGTSVDTEVSAQLPKLINLAERAIATDLKILGFLNVVTTDLVLNTSVYAKPDRWRGTVSMSFGTANSSTDPTKNTRVSLFPRSYEYCRNYWPNSAAVDTPEFYADYDYSHWLIVPTPADTYPLEILYYQQPPYLDTTNQTNWLTDYEPNLLLYRCLLEAAPYLKNDERIPVWRQMYEERKAAANGQDLQRILDRTSTRQET